VTSRPFLPWLDPAAYVLAPGGALEQGGAPWQLAGAASVVEENEPFRVGGSADHRSLRLPPGSSATSAAMCIGLERPTLRFFVRRSGGSPLEGLRVQAVVFDASGEQRVLPIATVLSPAGWAPTGQLPIVVGATSLAPGDAPRVAFRFAAQGAAQWSIDDVYVDPFRTG
jgi:hypothetical protein